MKTLLILIASCLSVNGQAMFFSQNVSTAVAPPAFVNAASGSDLSGVPAASLSTSAFSATAGNLIVVFARQSSPGGNALTGTITDTAGNTYTLIRYETLGISDRCGLWYATNIAGNASNVVTAAWSTNSLFTGVTAVQYSGLSTTSPLDTSTSANVLAATSITSPAFTTTAANEVLVAAGTVNFSPNTFTAGAGYAIVAVDALNLQAVENKVVSSIQTGVTASMSIGAAHDWEFIVATFKQ